MQEQNSDNDVPEQVSPSNSTSGAASAPTSATAEPPVSSQIINSGSATATIQPGLDNDATVAAVFHAVMVLQDVYGFSGDIAQYAVETVGTDLVTACNYILDNNLAQDGGGPVVPIDNCPHIQHHLCLSEVPSPFDPCSAATERTGGAKGDVEKDGSCPSKENWLCLQCGVVRCSRYVNGHGVVHYEASLKNDPGQDEAGHCLTASLSDLSVWCHACRAYIKDPKVNPVVKKLEELKFAEEGKIQG